MQQLLEEKKETLMDASAKQRLMGRKLPKHIADWLLYVGVVFFIFRPSTFIGNHTKRADQTKK